MALKRPLHRRSPVICLVLYIVALLAHFGGIQIDRAIYALTAEHDGPCGEPGGKEGSKPTAVRL